MFDINKPHQRRDGGEFEIVAIKDGFAFGFEGKNPVVWSVCDSMLMRFNRMESKSDIIQLPEEKEVVEYSNIYHTCYGMAYESLDRTKSKGDDNSLGIIKTTAKIIDGKLVSVKSEIVEQL